MTRLLLRSIPSIVSRNEVRLLIDGHRVWIVVALVRLVLTLGWVEGCKRRSMLGWLIIWLHVGHRQKLRLLDERLFLILESHTPQQAVLLLIKLHGHAEYFFLLDKLWLGMKVAHHSWVWFVNQLETISIKSGFLLRHLWNLLGVISLRSFLIPTCFLHLNRRMRGLMALSHHLIHL